jgi:hypothetical protein
MRNRLMALAAFAALALSGCATLMSGTTQAVNIRTEPPGAICDVESTPEPQYVCLRRRWHLCSRCCDTQPAPLERTASIATPGIVVLSRDSKHAVSCRLPGYNPASGSIIQGPNDWDYIVGNIFFGIIPGLITDWATGALNQLYPAVLEVRMQPLASTPGSPGELTPLSRSPATK